MADRWRDSRQEEELSARNPHPLVTFASGERS
jgi:hypothetical protein